MITLDGINSPHRNPAFIGGPKVHFGDHDEKDEEAQKLAGNFERQNTPHPKPQLKNKATVDGHVIQHEDDRRPSVVSLTRKPSSTHDDHPAPGSSNLPKSSLKHPPVHNVPGGADSSYVNSAASATKVSEICINYANYLGLFSSGHFLFFTIICQKT